MSDWKEEAIDRLEATFAALATEADPEFSMIECYAGFEPSGSRFCYSVADAQGKLISLGFSDENDNWNGRLTSSVESFRAECIARDDRWVAMEAKLERGGKLQVRFDYHDPLKFHPDREWFQECHLKQKREIEEFLRKKQAEIQRAAAEKPPEPWLLGAGWKEEAIDRYLRPLARLLTSEVYPEFSRIKFYAYFAKPGPVSLRAHARDAKGEVIERDEENPQFAEWGAKMGPWVESFWGACALHGELWVALYCELLPGKDLHLELDYEAP